ncbi:archaetidylserine decarboxylase [Iodobacter sp. CM08]|uniref:archaetidylserine decarboxylase n=1 Tax=Iodobacter sp. CM08 TaxID=3085902 RepID=UPI0029817EFD|nr:archaetidylserine decarboxylase [Iodobacter sp. CM08]MDW5417239.1 archaetidylserine decarboxylase [Iodobacter sp. CM08]
MRYNLPFNVCWGMPVSERLFVLLQHVLPKVALTQLLGLFAGLKAGGLTQRVIRWFIGQYKVNMSEAADSDPIAFATFNDFFTRALKPGVRPIHTTRFVSPVDGAISQLGAIKQEQIFQAKGRDYSATALLGGDPALAKPFINGNFATIYLSPRDYHRIHMPCDGWLTQMIYVPGELFSVNPATARGVDALFARNERVVCMFESDFGPFALVLVGATIVGSMATSWHGVVNPPRSKTVRRWDYTGQNIELKKGEEMGRFLLGSTVVMLFPKGKCRFSPFWVAERAVQMGEKMGD